MKAINSIIKSVNIKFNPNKLDETWFKANINRKNYIVTKSQGMRKSFSTKAEVNSYVSYLLKKMFIEHNEIYIYARRIILQEPNISLKTLRSLVKEYIRINNYNHIFTISLFNELYYIHNNKGIDLRGNKAFFISFLLEGSENTSLTNNQYFSLNIYRNKIAMEELDIILHLHNSIPKLPNNTRIYVNIRVLNLDECDDVLFSLHYNQE